jgi:hypothetical protein
VAGQFGVTRERVRQVEARAPGEVVFSVDAGKMVGSKENNQLLAELLLVHLAPPSKQAIARACKNFKALKGKKYPVAEEELAKRLPETEMPPPAPIVVPEAADDAESSLSPEGGAFPVQPASPADEGDRAPIPAVPVAENPPAGGE